MAEKLTPQQELAVHNRGGNLLVSAAAGSGKTKVLVDRLMEYLTDPVQPANIDDFLMITYTKAAASELRGKIANVLSKRIAGDPENKHLQRQMQRLYLAKISTVHSFCSDILREYAYRLDLPADFRVADETECTALREQVLERLLDSVYAQEAPNRDFYTFLDTQGLGRTDRLVAEIVQRVYDSARCHLHPEQWLEACLREARAEEVSNAGETVWGRFLMADLFAYLDRQIEAVSDCVRLAEAEPLLEKQAALLRSTVYQLENLRSSPDWDTVLQRKQLDYGRLNFPKKLDDPELTGRIKAVRAACKSGLEKKLAAFADPSAQVLADLEQVAPALSGMIWLVKEFSREYDSTKRRRRILDFGDLEHKMLELLWGRQRSGITAAAGEIGARFREILVDEYQDSNVVQDAIFSALTQKRQNLFMVGDVKQSIYQFRLADPGIFLEKYASYLPAEDAQPGQGRKVLLSANFRSGGGVIAAVNDVFADCMSPEVGGLHYGPQEALAEGIPHVPLPEPEVELCALPVESDTYAEEAAFVADKIAGLLDGTHMVRGENGLRPIQPEDIVILLRSPGSVGTQYQQALEQRGISCSTGGGVDLLQTAEVGTLRALLTAVSNPRQDIPLAAALTSPLLGFTADDLAQLRSAGRWDALYDALLHCETEKARTACQLLEQLRAEARTNTLTGLLERVFLLTGVEGLYGAMPGGDKKRENLQNFFQLAVSYEAGGSRDLGAFLQHLEALEEKGMVVPGAMSAAGAVSLMSIHKSKGLEFPVVFLCGLSRRFNREDLRAQVLCHKSMGLGLSCIDVSSRVRYPTVSKRAIAVKAAAESLSEELRVLYVAMTRARDRLIMTYASANLEAELQELTARIEYGDLLTAEADCPGHWVLLSALHRTEAGALFALGGKPAQTRVSAYPWRITVAEPAAPSVLGPEVEVTEDRTEGVDTALLQESLSFSYPFAEATRLPSKQTATQLKGRWKDREVAEDAGEPVIPQRQWRRPSFLEAASSGTTYGNAIHSVLQYISYPQCSTPETVAAEIHRLVQAGVLTPEQGKLADCRKIAAFFATGIGKKLQKGGQILREFKFSVLENAAQFGENLKDEQILLQGVVDCALVEPDGITVVDFKTDRVTEETLASSVSHYRPQIQAYARALSRIYTMPVKARYLYYFHLDRLVPVAESDMSDNPLGR